jgi:hypothetical protein
MKTPREFILEHHRSADRQLQSIRPDELAALAAASAVPAGEVNRPRFSLALAAARFWRESIRPWRRVWAGLAAVWIAILALQLNSAEFSGLSAKFTASSATQALAAWQERNRLLAQFLGPDAPRLIAKPALPGPRSELRREYLVV